MPGLTIVSRPGAQIKLKVAGNVDHMHESAYVYNLLVDNPHTMLWNFKSTFDDVTHMYMLITCMRVHMYTTY
jgi:hypothetical protein